MTIEIQKNVPIPAAKVSKPVAVRKPNIKSVADELPKAASIFDNKKLVYQNGKMEWI